MPRITVSVPYPVVVALYELVALMGGEQDVIGYPRRLELIEPDGRPASTAEDGEWRQVVEAWHPGGFYLRCFGTGVVDTHYGDQFSLIGARLRFSNKEEGLATWETLTARWAERRARLIAEYGTDATGRSGRPIKGALVRPWKEGAEIWIVGQQLTDGSAAIPTVWAGKLPAEIVRLTELPHGTCISEF